MENNMRKIKKIMIILGIVIVASLWLLFPKPSKDYHTYAGYTKCYVSKESPCMPFWNKAENDAHLRFCVYSKNGELLFESDFVAPGQNASWDAYEHFWGTSGVYFVDVTAEFAYPVKTGKELLWDIDEPALKTPDVQIVVE